MATTAVIEEERGTYLRIVTHPHNGYYAGDFSAAQPATCWSTLPAQRTSTHSLSRT